MCGTLNSGHMGKITSYRSGLSAVFVAFFVLTGVFVPTPTGEEVQTSVLTGTQEIPAEYLEKINRGYLDYIKTQTDLNVLIIDISDLDFVKKQEDYIFILNEINKKIVC